MQNPVRRIRSGLTAIPVFGTFPVDGVSLRVENVPVSRYNQFLEEKL